MLVAPTGVPTMHQAVIPASLDVGRWPRAVQHTNTPSISQTHVTPNREDIFIQNVAGSRKQVDPKN